MLLGEIRDELKTTVVSVEPDTLSGADAFSAVKILTEIENLASGLKARLGLRVKESGVWRRSGDKTAADLLARSTGSSVAEVERNLGTADKTRKLPELADAVASGAISPAQASAIAGAAAVDPTAEADLIETAGEEDLSVLREQALARRAAGERDPDRRYARQRARRAFRSWVDDEGMGHARWATTTDELAEMLAALEPFRRASFDAARRAGRRDPAEMYASDGLINMARAARDAANRVAQATETEPDTTKPEAAEQTTQPTAEQSATEPTAEQTAESCAAGPAAKPAGPTARKNSPATKATERPRAKRPVNMTVLVNNEALLRGFTEPGEICEIEGLGPIPASVARQFLTNDDPFITILLTDGTDIHRVARPGRRSTTKIKAALDARDQTCVVDGCRSRHRLEAHHLHPIALGGDTRLAVLAKLCAHHHDLITNHGWQLTGGPGHWQLISPDTLQFQDTG